MCQCQESVTDRVDRLGLRVAVIAALAWIALGPYLWHCV